MVLRVGLKVFGQLRNPFRQQRHLHVSATRILLMQLELLEIRRTGVLSHKRSCYCRLSLPNRKSPSPAVLPKFIQDVAAGAARAYPSPAGTDGATRRIVFDGIRELLMSL
jgi:hypothetical protein